MKKYWNSITKKGVACLLIIAMLLSVVPLSSLAGDSNGVIDVTLSDHAANKNKDANYIYFTVSPNTVLETSGWPAYYGASISINGETARTDIPIRSIGESIYAIDFYGTDLESASKEGMTVKIEGDLTDGMQTIRMATTKFAYTTDGMWKLDNTPDVTDVTLSDHAANARDKDANYIYFTVIPATTLKTGGWTPYYGSVISINGGSVRSDIPIRSVADGTYVVDFIGTDLESVSKEGMTIKIEGELSDGTQAIRMAATKFAYTTDGMWKLDNTPDAIDVTLSDHAANKNQEGNYIYFTVSPNTVLETSGWTPYYGSVISVNGGAVRSDIPIRCMTDGTYVVDFIGTDFENVSKEGMTVKIEGDLSDGTQTIRMKAIEFQYDEKWQVYIKPTTISNNSLNTTNGPTKTLQGLYFNVATKDDLSYENNWQVYSGDCVYVDGELVKNAKVIKADEQIYYVALVDNGIVPVAGTVVEVAGVLGDGTNYVRFASHKFTYTESGDWVDQDTQYLATAVNNKKTKKDEIWINGTVADKLDFNDLGFNDVIDDLGWKSYEGIVYANGILTSAKIYKNKSDLYCIYPNDLGVPVGDGLEVKIFGALTDETNQIYYMPITLAYSEADATWKLVKNASTGVPGDANADGKFDVADIIRAKYEEQMGDASTRLVSEGALYKDAFGKQNINVKKLHEIALSSEDGTPVYFNDETIMLGAYEGPQKAGAPLYNKGIQSGTLGSGQTLEEFKQFAKAGLNTLIVETPTFVSVSGSGDYALMGSGGGHWKNLTDYIQKATDANLDVIVSSEALNSYLEDKKALKADGVTEVDVTDTFLQRDLRQLLTGMVEESSTGSYPVGNLEAAAGAKGMLAYSNFKGILMGDELPYEHLEAYRKAHSILNELDASVPTFNSQFAGINEETGNSWAEEYGPVAGTFCYDMYPHVKDGTMKSDWLYNLQLSAKAGLQHDFTTGITLQAHGQTIKDENTLEEHKDLGLRDPKEKDDIGFQVYTSLAYGMKYLSYYTYAPHRKQEETHYYTGTMIEYDENQNIIETDTYRAVQAVNNEILKFDHVFLDYDWQGTIGISKANKDQLFGKLENYSTSTIASYNATHDALIGCMFDPDKNLNGYWLVNAVDPQDNQSNQVNVEFAGKTRAIVFNPSKGVYGEIQELNNNTYTAELGSGEGQFVIPLS